MRAVPYAEAQTAKIKAANKLRLERGRIYETLAYGPKGGKPGR